MSKETKSIRAEFTKKFKASSKIIRMLAKGKDTNSIAEKLELPMPTVRTVKGNLTRGYYLPYVQVKNGEVTGTCNF
jgi:DNA-binding NarL/FixJ family response regulator